MNTIKITVSGGRGIGKSTVAELIQSHLAALGLKGVIVEEGAQRPISATTVSNKALDVVKRKAEVLIVV